MLTKWEIALLKRCADDHERLSEKIASAADQAQLIEDTYGADLSRDVSKVADSKFLRLLAQSAHLWAEVLRIRVEEDAELATHN